MGNLWEKPQASRRWSNLTECLDSWLASQWYLHTSLPGHLFLLNPPILPELATWKSDFRENQRTVGFEQVHKGS